MATQLDMAEQQLYGWHCAQQGERLKSLVNGMGLKKIEWQKLKVGGYVSYLTEDEVDEIDEYFDMVTCNGVEG